MKPEKAKATSLALTGLIPYDCAAARVVARRYQHPTDPGLAERVDRQHDTEEHDQHEVIERDVALEIELVEDHRSQHASLV